MRRKKTMAERFMDAHRLIWADEILKREHDVTLGNGAKHRCFDTTTLYDVPTAKDAVEVVRCKDCKHHEDEEPRMAYCPNIVGSWVNEDFFCGYGERTNEVEE